MNPEDRYARHYLIDWWNQQKLREASVLVAGAGAIGNEVIKLLALMGVGHLLIVDFDTVEVTNLTRSILFREADVGRPKAEVAAERAREINPDIQVQAVVGDLEFDLGLGVYRAMDVVIGGLDSVNARLALNRACFRAGVPWLNGGIEATLAEIALFQNEKGACYECGLSPTMWERRNRRFSCGGLRGDDTEEKMPTTAIVASLCASYLVNEALYLLHAEAGHKDGLEYSQKLYLTVKPYTTTIQRLPQNPECIAHDLWSPVEILPVSPSQLTAASFLERVGCPEGTLELGCDLLTTMQCRECGDTETILQPLERCSEHLSLCPRCGTETRGTETISWLDSHSEWADRPLAALGLPEYAVIPVKTGNERRYVQLTGAFAIA
jgi:adenylyltransferase/sulfurtransferase